MTRLYFTKFILFACLSIAWAQPSNDNCENALVIPELSNWCSSTGAYSNVGATPSNYDAAECFSGSQNDVWFTFIAGATDVRINVIGSTSGVSGGTLQQPEVALLLGNCGGTMSEIRCENDDDNNNTIELRRGALIVGARYYIRVQGKDGNTGTFQLCINNFNPPAEPGSDEVTAAVLCDKSGFSVPQLSGGGNDPDEADDTCLDQSKSGVDLGNSESSSTWFTWTAETSGPLTFTLTPLQEDDDLDFALFELPNGVKDFSGKILLRCMATACLGPTGLDMSSTDLSEDINCDGGEDGFIRFIDMEEGVSYGLLINNFSDSGNGFNIEFGNDPGSGTFQGPEADFSSDEPDNQVCVGEDVSFDDTSDFPNGTITAWDWTFGVGANPQRAIGPGPHSVSYSSSGIKSIVLTIETNLGCLLTKISNFTVLPEMTIDPQISPPDCGGGTDGAIELVVSGGASPYAFNWGNTTFVPDSSRVENLPEGDYTVVIRDAEGCTLPDTILLREPGPALNADVEPVIPPSCTGFDDGRIVISATEGTPPYQYDFGNGLVSDSISSTVAAGVYDIYVVDSRGCDSEFNIEVFDPPLLLLDVDAVDVSCNGLDDGSALATSSGGHGEYAFEWSNGAVGEAVQGLMPGDFNVSVTDKRGCQVEMPFTINDVPPILTQVVAVQNAQCFGQADGSIEVQATGGNPPYEYAINGGDFQAQPSFAGLFAGTYTVTFRDGSGCSADIENIVVEEPPALEVEAGEDVTIKLGESITLDAITNDFPVEFNWTGPDSIVNNSQATTSALPFFSGHYTVTVVNPTGCQATDSLEVTVVKNRPIYIPNVFSPDGDGKNDNFTIFGGFAARQIKSLRIFNRWGGLVFEATNIPLNEEPLGWDGTFDGQKLNAGVFAFFTEVEFLDGEVVLFEGDVTLLR